MNDGRLAKPMRCEKEENAVLFLLIFFSSFSGQVVHVSVLFPFLFFFVFLFFPCFFFFFFFWGGGGEGLERVKK